MKKTVSGWGRYPVIEAEVRELLPGSTPALSDEGSIARGLGRSYGDSALSDNIYRILPRNRMLDFDAESGELHCEAGVSMAELLDVFVPRGWFPPVTAGTKYITVGGAIASDVHGKNHHRDGCFSEFVKELTLLGPDGEIFVCSREQHRDLFHATCGGMGLTGIILDAKVRMSPIPSASLDVLTLKAKNLEECFRLFEEYGDWPFSVAWLDSMAAGGKLGRSLLMVGKFREEGSLNYTEDTGPGVPFDLPGFLLNRGTVSAFNNLYYHRVRGRRSSGIQGIDSYFYPLDRISNWNRLYGSRGFLQYQFVLPKKNSYDGMKSVLEAIQASGRGSFLTVLKLMGAENDNFLSFPLEGFTLALDFKVQPGIFDLLDELDRLVAGRGGRIYLTKDARMSAAVFEEGYPGLRRFREVREKYGMTGHFESKQSRRLGI